MDPDGTVKVSLEDPSFTSIVASLPWLLPGGINVPQGCQPSDHVAIIVPYRDRASHLRIFLSHMHPFLSRQRLHYGIFIVEPGKNETFNRGKLMNVGFMEALKFYNWSCFVFHDVDLLPENDNVLYSCGSNPRHLSSAIDKFSYRLPYGALFGGATSVPLSSFMVTNGFSNDFWGWGGEDDDFSWRVRQSGYKIERFKLSQSHYRMIPHKREKGNPVNSCRYRLLAVKHLRWKSTGLNSLKYEVTSVNVTDLYINVVVNTLEAASRAEIKHSKQITDSEQTYHRARPNIVVVGGGLSGISACLGALNQKAKVTLIEGEKEIGGNSAKASSGINACESDVQKQNSVNDSCALFIEDTLKAGRYMNNPQLVKSLAERSAMFVNELPKWGVNLSQLVILGGHSVKRTHRIPPRNGKPVGIGHALIGAYYSIVKHAAALNSGGYWNNFRLLKNTLVTELMTSDDGAVIGVRAKAAEKTASEEIEADAVILTTGGYSNDHTSDSLIMEYASWMKNFPTTNGPFAVGSGIKMARRIGAKLVDMDQLQLHPTGFIDPKDPSAKTKFLAPESLRGYGGILLDELGRRFENELAPRDTLVTAITAYCKWDSAVGGAITFLVVNNEVVSNFGKPDFDFYWKTKHFFELMENGSMLAAYLNVPEQRLRYTFVNYSVSALLKSDPFGKTVFPVTFQWNEPLYVARVTPVIHYSMGGIVTDGNMQVLDVTGQVINGLFAAGEVTGASSGVIYDKTALSEVVDVCMVLPAVVRWRQKFHYYAGDEERTTRDTRSVSSALQFAASCLLLRQHDAL
uniref:FAD-dependent oxidoreductase 2 FAD binding domain-containing protein n=1 Tax=Trichuris muris TaxID=70415 RepID=A0A5S6QGK6_TRIMR